MQQVVQKPRIINGKIDYKAKPAKKSDLFYSKERKNGWTEQDDFNDIKLNGRYPKANETQLVCGQTCGVLDNKGQPAQAHNAKQKSWEKAYGSSVKEFDTKAYETPKTTQACACCDTQILRKTADNFTFSTAQIQVPAKSRTLNCPKYVLQLSKEALEKKVKEIMPLDKIQRSELPVTSLPQTVVSQLDQEVFVYTNRLRRNPKLFLPLLRERKSQFSQNMIRAPAVPRIKTQEGKDAVWDAIRTLEKTEAMPPLQWKDGMFLAARDHVMDAGSKGILNHTGSEGSSIVNRMSRFGNSQGNLEEANSFGLAASGFEVVMRLLIDDGVPDRANRTNLLNRVHATTGVCSGKHVAVDFMSTILFAESFGINEKGRNAIHDLIDAGYGGGMSLNLQTTYTTLPTSNDSRGSPGKKQTSGNRKHGYFVPQHSNQITIMPYQRQFHMYFSYKTVVDPLKNTHRWIEIGCKSSKGIEPLTKAAAPMHEATSRRFKSNQENAKASDMTLRSKLLQQSGNVQTVQSIGVYENLFTKVDIIGLSTAMFTAVEVPSKQSDYYLIDEPFKAPFPDLANVNESSVFTIRMSFKEVGRSLTVKMNLHELMKLSEQDLIMVYDDNEKQWTNVTILQDQEKAKRVLH